MFNWWECAEFHSRKLVYVEKLSNFSGDGASSGPHLQHLPGQPGLHFQRELTPQHPAASGRRRPHRAKGVQNTQTGRLKCRKNKRLIFYFLLLCMPVRCRWADGFSRVIDNRLSVCVHAVSGWETYLRVWHLEHILIGHVHLKGVNTYDIIEENDSKRIKKIKR